MRLIRKIAMVLGFAAYATSAHACFANLGYTDLHDALEADAVVHARLQGIEFLELSEVRRHPMLALVKLRTLDVLHGALPENYVSAGPTFDALVLVDRAENYLRGLENNVSVVVALHDGRGTVWRDGVIGNPNFPIDPSLLPDDPENMLRISHDICGALWLFEQQSPIGRALLQIFDGEGDRDAEIDVFARYLNMNGSND